MNEEDNQTQSMREYLKLKKISEDDKSDEMIEEIYEEIREDNTTKKGTTEKGIEER